ncbi:MAG: tRNA(Ile)-lysidine synthetase [Candidatus Binatia bacterium]|nr:MAG: tRNA(Ile)-lysidine synthetase [Candidatus Binatia bacterium]
MKSARRSPRCIRCRAPAVVHVRQHHAHFCGACFPEFFERQLERAIRKENMFGREDEVLVAVSGGKDSLALWEALARLGYRTTGLHLELGIGEYSVASREKTEAFARARGLRLLTVRLADEEAAVPDLARATRRPPCAACGLAKRHFFDAVALEHGFRVLATGHNLDDEAARLLGNVLRWQVHYLAKQAPVLEATPERFVRKVKPLYRTSEYETAAYAFLRRIDYIVDECPNARGATQLLYKDALNRIEAAAPGSKLSFVQEFHKVARPLFERLAEADAASGTCAVCGLPSWGETCAFCALRARARRREGETLPTVDAPGRA